MSTNKTENYNLHAWELEDDFLLSEINENFEALDAGLHQAQIVTGTYEGDSTYNPPRVIELGFRPRTVLVMANMSAADGNVARLQALAVEGVSTAGVTLTDEGFTVSGSLNQKAEINIKPNPYRYIAWK